QRHPARGPQWPDRSSSLPISQHALHGQGPGHQPDGAWLGEDADRNPEGNLPALDGLPEAPRLSHSLSDHRFSWRRSRRHRHHHRLGIDRDNRRSHHMARNGQAASNSKMKRKEYEKELEKLQVKLCHLQEWVKEKKLRVIILFEGRDA